MKLNTALALSSFVSLSVGAKDYSSPAIVSWGAPRVDLFGVTPHGSIWHKYQTTYGWEPQSSVGQVEVFGKASARSAVSAASWGPDRLNFVFIDDDGVVRHKYWTGYEWGPNDGYESLGKGPVRGVKITSWGKDRLDVIGLDDDGHLLHKAWTGSSWYPSVEEWEDLGGSLVGEPAAASWGTGRLDIFGVTDSGAIVHKYWNHDQWVPEGQKWDERGSKNFTASPVVSIPAVGRLDVWSVADQGELYHLFWDGSSWQGWESLGGDFHTTPQVIHFSPSNIDLVGRNGSDRAEYLYKHWDGGSWGEWHSKAGSFASEPAGVRLGDDNLQIVGIDTSGKIVFQVWNGYSWFPGPAAWYEIGDLEAKAKKGKNEKGGSAGKVEDLPLGSFASFERQRYEELRLVDQNRRLAMPVSFVA